MSEESRVRQILARRRVTLGFLFAALVFWLAAPTRTTLSIGVPIAVAGEALRIWAAGHLNKSREVTNSGPYRWLAHPLYAGSSIIGAGVAIASGSIVAAVLIAVYLGSTLRAAVLTEEAFLRRMFGDDYRRYRQTGEVNSARRFSAAQAIANREYRATLGLAVAVLLLFAKATYNGMFWRAAGQP
jgi:protein-S-isoprenylcysteine O-methyltransferase Ste14